MPATRSTRETGAGAGKKIAVVAAVMTRRLMMKTMTMKMTKRMMRMTSRLPLKGRPIDPHRLRSPMRKCQFSPNLKLYDDGMLDMMYEKILFVLLLVFLTLLFRLYYSIISFILPVSL